MNPVASRLAATALVAGFAVLSSCSGSNKTEPGVRPPPPGAPVIEVTMLDHRFQYDLPIPAGRVVFRARNAGGSPHHITMIPLPEDVASIDTQLRSSDRKFVKPFAGFYDRIPGDTGTFAVDLAPGQRYALICSVLDEKGEPHWRHGMASQFETAAPRS